MSEPRSMTGFGQAERAAEALRVTVSVRTVNHRHLDLAIRLPDDLRPLERQIGDCLRAELRRGRVDARVEVTHLAERPCRVTVASGAVAELRRAGEALADEGLTDRALTFADLLRLPDVVRLAVEPHAWGADEHRLVLEAVAAARDQAVAARRHEGARLAELVTGFLDELAALLDEVDGRRPEARQQLERAFRSRLDELLAGPPPSEERLAQEVALLVERSDIQEEVDRLRAHLGHGRELLGSGEPIGRRLEFLSQELLREINTLGAKSRDLPILRLVLDAKSVCDRLREQVQNIE